MQCIQQVQILIHFQKKKNKLEIAVLALLKLFLAFKFKINY